MKQSDLRIRPLSEGIGLGSLKTPSHKPNIPEIDTSVMRQAHAAYAPNSVARDIRRRPLGKAKNSILRFLAGAGSDIFVGGITFFLLLLVGVLAWNTGESGTLDVVLAFSTISGILAKWKLSQSVAAVVGVALLWRLVRIVFSKF
jgi:hypothetical protein